MKPWISDFTALGTDGFGRSEGREELRRFFEVDAENVAAAALWTLAQRKQIEAKTAELAIRELGLDPEKADPAVS